MKIRLTFLLLLLSSVYASAQCNIAASSLKSCLGSSILFNPSPVNAADSAYLWSFGDGSTSTQANPSYLYNSAGNFTVTLRVFKFGGLFCDAPSVQIKVLPKPIAKFSITSARKLCFENNLFEFTDSSKTGVSQAPIKARNILFDDGAIQIDNSPYAKQFSHHYTFEGGGKYKVVLEVIDTNNCIGQFIDSVEVYPKMQDNYLTSNNNMFCNKTQSNLIQTANYNSSNAVKIWWCMGNGDTLTSPWNNINYTYHYKDSLRYNPVVIVLDKNGCLDTTQSATEVNIIHLDSFIHIATESKKCFTNNRFGFTNFSTYRNNIFWEFEIAGIKQSQLYGIQDTVYFTAQTCGLAKIIMNYAFSNCIFTTDSTVMIYGPDVLLRDTTYEPEPIVQCQIFDTVRFRAKDINCYFGNDGQKLNFLWSFNDPFAPPCTTDTRNGINVGVNCNYSVDSMFVNHYYPQTNPDCYRATLQLTDPVRGCRDIEEIFLRLHPPVAGWDSTVNPVRRGLYYLPPSSVCDNIYSFYFDELIPRCGPDSVWFLPDSTCKPHVWQFKHSKGEPKFFQYSYAISSCNNKDTVYYGVVVKNGTGNNGISCYDTAWYPLYIKKSKIPEIVPTNISLTSCAPFKIALSTKDSINKNLKSYTINFGDNTPNFSLILNNHTDTILPTVTHFYNKNGIYEIKITIVDQYDCNYYQNYVIELGKIAKPFLDNALVCLGGEINVYCKPYYVFDVFSDQWEDTARSNAGLEQIYWNFGDDSTWVRGGVEMKHTYKSVGEYQIKIAYKDSSVIPCFDTIISPELKVYVTQIVLKTGMIKDTFFCAPSIIPFYDSSTVMMPDGTIDNNQIDGKVWNFGLGKPTSSLSNPSIFYPQNGTYQTSFTITSNQGCSKDTTLNFVILGPEPSFIITTDTFACAPARFVFKNTTGKKIDKWIWYFNDVNGSIYSTKQDTDVFFTYNTPGTYKVDLVGEDIIFNPITGTSSTCSQKFPYVNPVDNWHSRQVVVLPTDTLTIFSKDSICIGEELTVLASNSNQIQDIIWYWGNGDSSFNILNSQSNYVYQTPGTYSLKVVPVISNPLQCVVQNQKNINVLNPQADFSFNADNYPLFIFQNQSQNATRYEWNFGQPTSPNNISTLTNPEHNYGNDNKVYTVCLTAYDNLNCWDSVCKVLPIKGLVEIPNVFTPDNSDGKNDAYDITIEGWEKYDLVIYNRWGTLVYESKTDGFGNDGINWNGRDKNTGNECPPGVYFMVFKYKLMVGTDQEYKGTITLIRN